MKKGDKVHWNYGRSQAEGKIEKEFTKPVSKRLKGSEIKRNASKEEPAYLIRQENGNEILRSESELKKGSREKK